MNKWKCIKEYPITKSGFYKVLLESGNIHYARCLKRGPFMSGIGRDYRNGDRYPIIYPIKYVYLFGLNNKWQPDENVKEEDWPDGI
jgi:hypothetical protein